MAKKLSLSSSVLFALVFSHMQIACLADAPAQLREGETLAKNGQYEQAEAIYKQVLTDHAGTDQAFQAQDKLACLYVAWGREPEAQAALEQLLANFSEHEGIAAAVTHVADAYRESEKYENACEIYEYVIANSPQDEHALWSQMDLVVANAYAGNDSAADTALGKLLTQYSGHELLPKALLLTADHHRRLEKHNKACEIYQYALDNSPDAEVALWAQMGLAISNIRLGDDDLAQQAIEKLVTESSQESQLGRAIHWITQEYRRLRKYEHAQQVCRYAKDVLNSQSQSNPVLGTQVAVLVSSIELGDEPDIQAAIDKLIADFKDHPDLPAALWSVAEPYYDQAFACEGEGFDAEARDYFTEVTNIAERILQEFPTCSFAAEAHHISATCYQRFGEHTMAIEHYEKIVDNWPDYEYAWSAQFLIGRNYKQLSQIGAVSESEAYAQIKAACEQVLQKYPNCPAANAARDWLEHNVRSSEGE